MEPQPEPEPQRRRDTPLHFLVVSYPAQGHVNPTLQLAKRLTRLGSRVTFSTPVAVHRRIAPPSSSSSNPPDAPPIPLLHYSPYSIGPEYDADLDPVDWDSIDRHHYMRQLQAVGSRTLLELARGLADAVTCVVYNFLVPWADDVARELGVPSLLYWIQPATVFGVYYHYFHGHADLIASRREDPFCRVELPGLPPMRIRDIPSLLTSGSRDDLVFFPTLEELFRRLDDQMRRRGDRGPSSSQPQPRLRVLVNTFEALEGEQLRALDSVELVPVGPVLPSAYTDGVDERDTAFGSDLFDGGAEERYKGWLDARAARSVVYVSFGSFTVLSTRQREEISRALEESGRPYLWVVRGSRDGVAAAAEGRGMAVDWCSQVEVLSHPAVGCFVTHCGWNSTLESMACGVPVVGLPRWTDQAANAMLAERVWGTGVRAEVGAAGLLEAGELRRCLDLVMGEGGVQVRQNAAAWRARAREAARPGGSSDQNLRALLQMPTK